MNMTLSLKNILEKLGAFFSKFNSIKSHLKSTIEKELQIWNSLITLHLKKLKKINFQINIFEIL